MKVSVTAALAAVRLASLTGCSSTVSVLNGAAAVTAKIAANSPTACADLRGLGVVIGTAARQAAAANPNNATVQKVAANLLADQPPANADCLLVANLAGLVSVSASGSAAPASVASTE